MRARAGELKTTNRPRPRPSPVQSWPAPTLSSSPPPPLDLSRMAPAEAVILQHLRLGLTNREIATFLGKSEFTVKNQVSTILRKVGLPTRARLIALLR
jgi:DNA-binding NarL/FixJ family response regulator